MTRNKKRVDKGARITTSSKRQKVEESHNEPHSEKSQGRESCFLLTLKFGITIIVYPLFDMVLNYLQYREYLDTGKLFNIFLKLPNLLQIYTELC